MARMEPMGPARHAFWRAVFPLWCKAIADTFAELPGDPFDISEWLSPA